MPAAVALFLLAALFWSILTPNIPEKITGGRGNHSKSIRRKSFFLRVAKKKEEGGFCGKKRGRKTADHHRRFPREKGKKKFNLKKMGGGGRGGKRRGRRRKLQKRPRYISQPFLGQGEMALCRIFIQCTGKASLLLLASVSLVGKESNWYTSSSSFFWGGVVATYLLPPFLLGKRRKDWHKRSKNGPW